MDKKREQELREQYRIWKEEEIKWQKRQEEESRRKEEEKKRKEKEEKEKRRAKLWEEYEEKEGTGIVECPYCKGLGFTSSDAKGVPTSWDCSYCKRTGRLDTRENNGKKTIIDFLEVHGYWELMKRRWKHY